MTFLIRPAEAADVPLLAEVYRAAVLARGGEGYAPEQVAVWAAFSDDPSFGQRVLAGVTWIAESGGRPAAFAQLEPGDHLGLLYCHPQFFGTGAASAVLARATQEATRRGAAVLHLEASRVARPFFERRGFQVIEREVVERCGLAFERFRMARLLFAPEITRWLVLGNSGSGKSTLARRLAALTGGAVLDLDTIAWRSGGASPERCPRDESACEIERFVAQHPAWVLEGCYEDLIELRIGPGTGLVFLDPSPETCAARVRSRAFEPHKYVSPEAQRSAVEGLVTWIRDYPHRSGPMSRAAHCALFASAPGPKLRVADL
jgi:adenylate kinase family enzyme/GNAT superfamily N-acetyltransferase